MRYLIAALRPRHWIKNLLVFLPLVFGKKLFTSPYNLRALAAFAVFSMAAGSVYVINDLIDIDLDRRHPTKRLRAIASGKLRLRQAWITAYLLAFMSVAASFLFEGTLGWVIVTYLLLNLIYTKFVKYIILLDVFCVSCFFLLRIVAGGIAADTTPSFWIIALVTLLALFLGFNKRRQDVRIMKGKGGHAGKIPPGYSVAFIDQVVAILTALLLIVYTLYIVDLQAPRGSGAGHLVYSLPLVYYGIFRYLYLIHRKIREGDPTRIFFSDPLLRVDFALWVLLFVAVIYFGM